MQVTYHTNYKLTLALYSFINLNRAELTSQKHMMCVFLHIHTVLPKCNITFACMSKLCAVKRIF